MISFISLQSHHLWYADDRQCKLTFFPHTQTQTKTSTNKYAKTCTQRQPFKHKQRCMKHFLFRFKLQQTLSLRKVEFVTTFMPLWLQVQVHCISGFLLISHAVRYLCTYMRVCLCVSVCLCVCAHVLVCSRLRAGVCIPDRMKAMSTLKSAPVPNLTASIDFWLCGRPSARIGWPVYGPSPLEWKHEFYFWT